ncbi:ATP binding protein [Sistotremastrum suecicum HHB10207 ss-3]|uniref:ATP binding protein n=1 Tax=Sistotremastrum suecicum HHB10207 ss-3 TaxID=1314776 RepID=A0A165ZZT2_9AGAM|nr:ATP binding protein [Sistotremastrum suecicum HHB10207 ss-3]
MAASVIESEGLTTRISEAEEQNALDLNLIKEFGRRELVDSLNAISGAKTLVLDPSLVGPLGLLTEVSLLKHHGVSKIFWLEASPLAAPTTAIIYLTRPTIGHIKAIANHIKQHSATSPPSKHLYYVLLVPRSSVLVKKIFEDEGVLGDVNLSTFEMGFIPLEDDLLSLERDSAFKEIWMNGDETVIYDSAQALVKLQRAYGLFPRILGKGDEAARLINLVTRLSPSSSPTAPLSSDKIDSLIVIDRKVDMITPMLTQLTYEGLIDELIGIKNSYVEVPASLLAQPTAPNSSQAGSSASGPSSTPLSSEKKKKHHLTAVNDTLFAEIRDLNFSAVPRKLQKAAHRLDEEYKNRLQSKSIAQIKEFVGRIGGIKADHQALNLHTGLSELIAPLTRTTIFDKSLEIQQNLLASYDPSGQITAIEDLIAQGAPLHLVIRLITLASLTTGSLKQKTLESLKREILQAHGYTHLPLLISLSSPSLSMILPNPLPSSYLKEMPNHQAPPKFPFTSARKSLRLFFEDLGDGGGGSGGGPVPSETVEGEPDISYVYSVWAPMSVRLVQCVAQKGAVLAPLNTPAPPGAWGDSATGGGAGGTTGGKKEKIRAHPIVGWKGFEDIVGNIPGETVDIVQLPSGASQGANGGSSGLHSLAQRDSLTTTTIVFFLGGCTFAEIAALRWMTKQSKGRRYVIATTGIISGRSLIESLGSINSGSAGLGPSEGGLAS